jgi:hypothetical protein
MKITNTSPLTGKLNAMEIDCTLDQIKEYMEGLRSVQAIFPNLNADEREFIKTGYTPSDWSAMFGDDDEE